MQLLQYFIVLTFVPSGVKTEFGHSDRHDYVSIITHICKVSQISAVFFTHSGELNEDLGVNTLLLEWTRSLSRHGIASLNIHLWEIWRLSIYYKRIVRPLFIIVLTNEDSVRMFSIATQNIYMAFPDWFVFFKGALRNYRHDYCHDPPGNIFHLTFHTRMWVMCEGELTLRAWYALNNNNRTKIIEMGYWHPEAELVSFMQRSFFASRNNMEGIVLRAVIVQGSPVAIVKNGIIDGYFGRVLHELTVTMNFSVEIVKEVSVYGRWRPETNSWDGAIAEIVNGNADIAISDFSMTMLRMRDIDYTLPLSLSRNYLFVREGGSNGVQWFAYFWAFSSGSWISIILIITLAPVLLTVVSAGRKSHTFITLLLDNYLYVWGIFCQQGLSEFPSGFSLRVAYISILLSTLVVSSMYSAALISFLAIYIPNLPFLTIEGFAKDGTYEMITLRGSADYEIFVNAFDPLGRSMMRLMKEERLLPSSYEEGFVDVCDPYKRNAYFTSYAVYKALRGKMLCKVAGINAGRVDSLGFIMCKGSPYINLMNYQMQQFLNNGMLNRMKQLDDKIGSPVEIKPKPIGLSSVTPILAIFLGGCILSVVVLSVEMLYFGIKKKVSSQLTFTEQVKVMDFNPSQWRNNRRFRNNHNPWSG